jgi:hypothetical protein
MVDSYDLTIELIKITFLKDIGCPCGVCHTYEISSFFYILFFRYTDRKKSAIQHFKQALSMDPLMWAAYEELCILGM